MQVRIAIDMGNSETAIALFNEEGILGVKRVKTDRFGKPSATPDLLADALRSLREETLAGGSERGGREAGPAPVAYEGSVVATVVPAHLEMLTTALSGLHRGEPLVVGPSIDLGIRIGYERPADLGPDRIADAAAGHAEVGGAVIVVDLGTATTFNAVTADGIFLGGAIAPGIGTGADALARAASRLFRPSLTFPERVIGRTTEESLRSGILHGAVTMIDGMADLLRAEMGGAVVIATGGFAPLVAPQSRTIDRSDELLTLKGLKLLYERNRGASHPAPRA
jgi:type III pantothenate kinase